MKKGFKALSIAITSTLMVSNVFGSVTGDFDNDGRVTATDAVMVFNNPKLGYNAKEILKKALNDDYVITTEEVTEVTTKNDSSSSKPAETTTNAPVDTISKSDYGVQGFASNMLKGIENNGITYETMNVSDAKGMLDAIYYANKSTSETKGIIINVQKDLSLGYKEIEAIKKTDTKKYSDGLVKELATPLTHPTLMDSGVSQITISGKNVILYSENGSTIKHVDFVISGAENVIIRNLTFAELWEWDEFSGGHYDKNDWDYIGIQSSSKNVWIDHCTFKKSYDGIVDSKNGSNGVSITWCKFESDYDFVKEQIAYLEENIDAEGVMGSSNLRLKNGTGKDIEALGITSATTEQTCKYKYPLYRYLRKVVGMTTEEIISASLPQQKTHLIGAGDTEENREQLEITLAYNYYEKSRDRMPRLRGGNAWIYNTVFDSTGMNTTYNKYKDTDEFKDLTKIQVYSAGDKSWENFDFSSTSQACLSTVGGALSIENSIMENISSPMKNNQKGSDSKYDLFTGKMRAIDVSVDGTTTTWDGTQDAINNDTSNKLYPKGNTPKVFSWNETANKSVVDKNYTKVELDKLEDLLKNNAGAGKNLGIDWTKTTYED